MAKLVQKTESETEAKLLELSAPGNALIERTTGTARSSRGEYRLVGDAVRALGPAIAFRSRSRDDADRKIVTIVGKIGTITGRVVQAMFDVQPATASRILSDLVDRGILVKTSTASRGSSMITGPAPSPRRMSRSARAGR